MFGTGDNQQSNNDPAMLDNVKQLASQPADQVVPAHPASDAPAAVAEPAVGFSSMPSADVAASPAPASAPSAPPTAPAAPTVDMTPPQAASDTTSADEPMSQPPQIGGVSTSIDDTQAGKTTSDPDPQHLAGLKQQALDHLEPLTDHIEGTPEETFKTTMMMIQANDNHTLLEKALASAKKIEDDKARAQAMLDIINEINYFAQASSGEQPTA